VKDARELADADDLVAREVGDRRLADDRRHVMLAVRLEGDVLEKHDLVVATDLLEGAAEMHGGVLGVAARIFAPRLGDAPRRVEQAFPVGIVAGPPDQRPDRLANFPGNVARRRRFDEVAVLRVAMLVH
jgi:hypothetical protein